MADITKTSAVKNGAAVVTLNNGATSQTIPVTKDELFVLYIRNLDTVSARVMALAGNGIASAMGNAFVDVAQNGEAILGPFESARFVNTSTGKITVVINGTNDAPFSGTITNVKLAGLQL